ncbi:MAG: T9SS C-terminal target domain-containing protein [Calditrichaeota bacterium]|nr:MAG: T9SS C-terminal target domain-containing protein [Calditrichota bacterium]
MKRKFTWLALLAMLLMMVTSSTAQTPQAVIVVEAWSPKELHDAGRDTHPSQGLTTVGKGELVYLLGKEATGQEVTAYQWSLVSVPEGSAAVLDSVNTQRTTFVPDTTGQYVVQLSITTASGTSDTTLTITSSNYVGVGIWTELLNDPSKSNCSPCHTDKVSEWVQTEHPTLFKKGIEGVASAHYAERCIECHTLGYNTSPTADNGGFDDVATDLGWTFPDTLKESNWDDLVTNFPDLAKLGSIQCENCHGPAGEHKKTFNKELMDVSLEEGVCGRCHEEEPYHRKNIQWKRSGHSAGDVAFGAERTTCAPCHSGYGFVNRIDPDVPFEQGTGFPFISCAVCHDPHNAQLPHQVRSLADVTLMNGETFTFGGMGKLCMNCHLSRRDAEVYVQEWHDHYGPHHSNQADMLAGTNAITFDMHIPSSNHKEVVPDACVTCHMAPTPGTGQPGRDYVGEHTFAMHWDGGTPDDPTDDVYNVAACQQCHGNIQTFADIKAKEDYDGDGVIESAQDEVRGMMEEVGKLLPPLGSPEVEVTQEDYDPNLPDLTPEEVAKRKLYLKAAYNYKFVEEDGSHGIHNFQFAVNLLRVTHQALTTGSMGAGTILSISDVPNDQGKQVRIVWTRFGGDGVGDNPILNYLIWRRVDDQNATTSSKEGAVFESLESLPKDLTTLTTGTRVVIAGDLWDFAGSVPAAGFDQYSAIAPTLFDSTKTEGMYWSVFRISGHTSVPAVYAITAPDSGYSVDNLAPQAPANVVAVEVEEGVALSWDEPVDEDFNYFALYRSTTPGFDPRATEPIATLTGTEYVDREVQVGTTYYYRLSAFDFSGNESEFSDEIALLVTSIRVSDGTAIPENYVLYQNFPNPFNPTTTIRFGLKESGHVKLSVYNALGEKVMTLIDGELPAGYHRVSLSGKNLSSGLYFYRLEVNKFVAVKKMIVLK